MSDINTITLTGRVSQEPELNYTQNSGTAILSFSLANNQWVKSKEKEEPTFFKCKVVGARAERLTEIVVKGVQLTIGGRMCMDKYKNKDGIEVKIWYILVSDLILGRRKGDNVKNN